MRRLALHDGLVRHEISRFYMLVERSHLRLFSLQSVITFEVFLYVMRELF